MKLNALDWNFQRRYPLANGHNLVVVSKTDFSFDDGLAFVRHWLEHHPLSVTPNEASVIEYEPQTTRYVSILDS